MFHPDHCAIYISYLTRFVKYLYFVPNCIIFFASALNLYRHIAIFVQPISPLRLFTSNSTTQAFFSQDRYYLVHIQRHPTSPDPLPAMLYIISARPCSAHTISGPPCSPYINRRVNVLTLYNFGRQNVDVVASIP